MSVLIAVIVITILNVLCFTIGAIIGQKVVKQEPIKIPNPVKVVSNAIEEHKEKEEYNKEQEKLRIISENIDNYDGTSIGQQDIPNY